MFLITCIQYELSKFSHHWIRHTCLKLNSWIQDLPTWFWNFIGTSNTNPKLSISAVCKILQEVFTCKLHTCTNSTNSKARWQTKIKIFTDKNPYLQYTSEEERKPCLNVIWKAVKLAYIVEPALQHFLSTIYISNIQLWLQFKRMISCVKLYFTN